MCEILAHILLIKRLKARIFIKIQNYSKQNCPSDLRIGNLLGTKVQQLVWPIKRCGQIPKEIIGKAKIEFERTEIRV